MEEQCAIIKSKKYLIRITKNHEFIIKLIYFILIRVL